MKLFGELYSYCQSNTLFSSRFDYQLVSLMETPYTVHTPNIRVPKQKCKDNWFIEMCLQCAYKLQNELGDIKVEFRTRRYFSLIGRSL